MKRIIFFEKGELRKVSSSHFFETYFHVFNGWEYFLKLSRSLKPVEKSTQNLKKKLIF